MKFARLAAPLALLGAISLAGSPAFAQDSTPGAASSISPRGTMSGEGPGPGTTGGMGPGGVVDRSGSSSTDFGENRTNTPGVAGGAGSGSTLGVPETPTGATGTNGMGAGGMGGGDTAAGSGSTGHGTAMGSTGTGGTQGSNDDNSNWGFLGLLGLGGLAGLLRRPERHHDTARSQERGIA